jgi:hypothetical protein
MSEQEQGFEVVATDESGAQDEAPVETEEVATDGAEGDSKDADSAK